MVFDEWTPLPEAAAVCVELADSPARRNLAERFKDITGTAHDLPEDMTENHDDYYIPRCAFIRRQILQMVVG